jgi:NDP-sugar pyrophosphorylase family protein
VLQRVVGVVLAAGRGERLRPLTDAVPKALVTVKGTALIDLAIARLRAAGVRDIAVNAHYRHEQLEAHLAGQRVHVEVEQPEALGTAGALGNLRHWIDGRDVIVTNCDAWYSEPPPPVIGAGIRLLAVRTGAPADFDHWLYAGTAFMPWTDVRELNAVPSGLYEVCWRAAWETNRLVVVPFGGRFIDCGTPDDLEAANSA